MTHNTLKFRTEKLDFMKNQNTIIFIISVISDWFFGTWHLRLIMSNLHTVIHYVFFYFKGMIVYNHLEIFLEHLRLTLCTISNEKVMIATSEWKKIAGYALLPKMAGHCGTPSSHFWNLIESNWCRDFWK